jgi:hypothetical protein
MHHLPIPKWAKAAADMDKAREGNFPSPEVISNLQLDWNGHEYHSYLSLSSLGLNSCVKEAWRTA